MYYNAVDSYRKQQVLVFSAEKQAALLMEAGQVSISKAIKAIKEKNFNEMGSRLLRSIDIIDECIFRLDIESGEEAALNLLKIYDWWSRDIFEVAITHDIERLKTIYEYMGELKQTWESIRPLVSS